MNIKRHVAIVLACCCFFSGAAAAGSITIKGSTTILPIAQRMAQAYSEESPDTEISVSGGGSGDGIKELLDGTTDIAASSRFLKDIEAEKAVDKKTYLVPFAIAHDCVVPIVHPLNPVVNLTIQQLKGIYKGKIVNWKQVGGPDKRIVVISRKASSGTFDVWEDRVMNEERITRFALSKDSNDEVVQAVSGNTAAIGYVAIGYLDKSVKGLDVNGVKASAETAIDGSFPLHRALYLFTNGRPTGEILNFLNFALDPDKGQKQVKEAGFVPLY